MARISLESLNTLVDLQLLLLKSIDEAKRSEYLLLENFGETEVTIATLDELTAIAMQASDLYTQISRLLLQVSEIQPIITPAVLRLLSKRISTIKNIPALQQSIREIKSDWGLL